MKTIIVSLLLLIFGGCNMQAGTDVQIVPSAPIVPDISNTYSEEKYADFANSLPDWVGEAAKKEIAKGCIRYYDGCNINSVTETGVKSTLMSCPNTEKVITCREYR
jgi:hypothetical protein